MVSPVLEMHVCLDDLKRLIKREKKAVLRHRLLFVRQLYAGESVADACERMCVSEDTGYRWLKDWNESGLASVARKPGSGRPPRLSARQLDDLRHRLKKKANWLTREVRALIKCVFGVAYSNRQVQRILRSFRMHYARPYPRDYRRPKDAEAQLAQSLHQAVGGVSSGCVVGFMDEASPQTTANTQRFWSFDKPQIVKNTSKIRANTFGFYPINGREVVEFMPDSKSPRVCEFLHKIRWKNPAGDIIVVLDNARGHIAKATREYAEKLRITLVFLPPYSPDLNPIEHIWRPIKKKLSTTFTKTEHTFKETIRTTYHRHAKKQTFMKNWLTTYQPILSDFLCP